MDRGELSRNYALLVGDLIKRGLLKTKNIIDAFKMAVRYEFIPKEYLELAHEDTPLPIAQGSTISQPSTVAIMLEELDPLPGEKVLEIGTGSGWQTAILSFCVAGRGKVITIEIDKDVFEFAKRNISKFKVENIVAINADGAEGHQKGGPYDKIIFTAAIPEIPLKVLGQLKVGGKLLAPVGENLQAMISVTKTAANKYDQKDMGLFIFVPIRRQGLTA